MLWSWFGKAVESVPATGTPQQISFGYNGNNGANLPKGTVTLNDTASYTITGNGGRGTCKHRWKQADADDTTIPFAYTVYSTPGDSSKPGARWVMRKVNLAAGASCDWTPQIAVGAGNWRSCAGCSTNFDSAGITSK